VARNQMPRQGCDQIDLRQLDERHHEIRNRECNTPRLPFLGKLGIDGTMRIANRGHEHVLRRQVGFEARARARGWPLRMATTKSSSKSRRSANRGGGGPIGRTARRLDHKVF